MTSSECLVDESWLDEHKPILAMNLADVKELLAEMMLKKDEWDSFADAICGIEECFGTTQEQMRSVINRLKESEEIND